MITNLSDSTPAAPGGSSNVKWQQDGSGNGSAYVTFPASSGAPTGTAAMMFPPNSFSSTNPALNDGTLWGMGPSQAGGTMSNHLDNSSGGVPPNWRILATSGASCRFSSIDLFMSPGELDTMQFYSCLGQTSSSRMWLGISAGQDGTMRATDPATSFVGFRYDSSVSANWFAYVSDGASHTATDTGIAADTSFHQFKVVADGSGGFDFYIDKVKKCNIPTGATGMPTANTAMLMYQHYDASAGTTQFALLNSCQIWKKN